MKDFYKWLNLDKENEAELSIFDEISPFYGTRAKDFMAQLKNIKGTKLTLNINSPGGSVMDGYAIYNMLRASGKDITVKVVGIAASIAAVIAMAGKKILMPENTFMFIHDPLVQYVTGNAEDFRKIANDLDKIKEGVLSIFEARTGSDRAKISKLMAAETLMTAKEAMKLGFADEVLPEISAQNVAFKFQDYHPGVTIPTGIPPVGQPQNKDNTMTETEQKRLDDALEQVRVLKGEVQNLQTAGTEFRNKAQQDITTAVNAVTTKETERKKALKDYAAKHGKDGDLDGALADAVSGTTTLDEFKDKVLEVVSNRPSKAAAKQGTGGAEGDKSDEGLQKQYEACKTPSERRVFLAENRAWSRRMSRG